MRSGIWSATPVTTIPPYEWPHSTMSLISSQRIEINNVGDVGAEINRLGQEVRPVGDARERRRIDAMTLGGEPVVHSTPTPSPVPGAMNENKSFAHPIDPVRCDRDGRITSPVASCQVAMPASGTRNAPGRHL